MISRNRRPITHFVRGTTTSSVGNFRTYPLNAVDDADVDIGAQSITIYMSAWFQLEKSLIDPVPTQNTPVHIFSGNRYNHEEVPTNLLTLVFYQNNVTLRCELASAKTSNNDTHIFFLARKSSTSYPYLSNAEFNYADSLDQLAGWNFMMIGMADDRNLSSGNGIMFAYLNGKIVSLADNWYAGHDFLGPVSPIGTSLSYQSSDLTSGVKVANALTCSFWNSNTTLYLPHVNLPALMYGTMPLHYGNNLQHFFQALDGPPYAGTGDGGMIATGTFPPDGNSRARAAIYSANTEGPWSNLLNPSYYNPGYIVTEKALYVDGRYQIGYNDSEYAQFLSNWEASVATRRQQQ